MKPYYLLIPAALFFVNTPVTFYAPSGKEPVRNLSMKITTTQNGEFAFFRTHRQGKTGVTAVWGFTSIDEVTGFLVQRTYQDPADPYSFWEDVSTVAADPSRSFTYTDKNVLPGVIYYRIAAQIANGSSIVSEVSGVRIVSH